MSEKKDINRLFQERFKDFEAQPPAALWDQIERQLPAKKKNRKAGWLFYSGIAAGIAILFSLIYFANFNETTTVDQQIVNQEETTTVDTPQKSTTTTNTIKDTVNNTDTRVANKSTDENEENLQSLKPNSKVKSSFNTTTVSNTTGNNNSIASGGIHSNSLKENNSVAVSKTTKTKTSSTVPKHDKNSSLNSPLTNNRPKNSTAVTISNTTSNKNKILEQRNQKDSDDPTQQSFLKDVSKNTLNLSELAVNKPVDDLNQPQDSTAVNQLLEDAVAQQELEKKGDSLSNKAMNGSRFQGSTMIAPIFSNATGSSLNNSVANNERSAGYNLSYGVALGYELNDRWTVRAGVHKVDVSYNTQDVRYGATIPSATVAGNFDQNGVSNAIVPSGAAIAGAFPEIINNSFKGFDGELTQQLGYIEMPLEIRYNITNSRLKLSMTGGFSALFLQENNVRITDDNQRLELGSDDNFRDFNQSANFGIGLNYGLTDKIGVMLEPMFKYQLNALERNTANFRPYTLGMYSGLTFNF
jgi:hypothetical protein